MERKLFNYWRKKLNLSDWTIKFEFNVDPDDMAIEGACGATSFVESCKSAIVQIVDPKKMEDGIVPFNLEETIVHELLHLKLSLITTGSDAMTERVGHQIIDDLSKSFVATRKDHEIKGENK